MSRGEAPMARRIPAWARWLFWAALAVYVGVLPIQHTIALRYVAFLLLLVATMGLLTALRQGPRLPLAAGWIAYAGVAAASLLYAVSPADAFGEIRTEILYGFLLFSLAATWARALDILHGLGFIVAGVNLVLALTALRHVDFATPMEQVLNLPAVAFAGVNSNFIVAILPFLAYFIWQLWRSGSRGLALGLALVLVPLDTAALLISYNRQTAVALAAAMLCAGALLLRARFTWRRLMGFAAIIVAVAGLFVAQVARRSNQYENLDHLVQASVSQDIRWELWRFSLEKIAERPWSGGGFGRDVFDKLYADFHPENPLLWHAHNMVLDKGIQMGIPGMAAFLFLWFVLCRALARHLGASPRRHALAVAALATVAAVFTKNMTDDFFVRDTALLFWLLMGAMIGSLERGDDASR